MTSYLQYSKSIKQKAQELGFSACGIAKAGFMEQEARLLESWLQNGYHGKMQYMENHFDKRTNPSLLLPGAKSVISLLYNYYTPVRQHDPEAPVISTYAYGEDYHFVLKDKLRELFAYIATLVGSVEGRVFVDSAPVLERSWAERSGLGWIGKNGNLIQKASGSFFFISEIILDAELEYDSPATDHCGTCTACIDACPTEAIVAPRTIAGSKCISYFTIELKDELPPEMKGRFANRMFGCDICQDVCPWNRFSQKHQEPRFEPSEDLLSKTQSEWKEITAEVFQKLFKKSAVQRTQYNGLKRNIDFLL